MIQQEYSSMPMHAATLSRNGRTITRLTPNVRETGVITLTRWSHTVFQPITVRIASTESRIWPTLLRGYSASKEAVTSRSRCSMIVWAVVVVRQAGFGSVPDGDIGDGPRPLRDADPSRSGTAMACGGRFTPGGASLHVEPVGHATVRKPFPSPAG